jgi:hypothetical protein
MTTEADPGQVDPPSRREDGVTVLLVGHVHTGLTPPLFDPEEDRRWGGWTGDLGHDRISLAYTYTRAPAHAYAPVRARTRELIPGIREKRTWTVCLAEARQPVHFPLPAHPGPPSGGLPSESDSGPFAFRRRGPGLPRPFNGFERLAFARSPLTGRGILPWTSLTCCLYPSPPLPPSPFGVHHEPPKDCLTVRHRGITGSPSLTARWTTHGPRNVPSFRRRSPLERWRPPEESTHRQGHEIAIGRPNRLASISDQSSVS